MVLIFVLADRLITGEFSWVYWAGLYFFWRSRFIKFLSLVWGHYPHSRLSSFLLMHKLSFFFLLVEYLRCSVRVFSFWLDQNSLYSITSVIQQSAFSSSSQLTLQNLALNVHNTSIGQRSSGDPNRNFWVPAFKQSPLLYYPSLKTWRSSGW